MTVQGFWATTVTELLKLINEWLVANPFIAIVAVSQSQDPGSDQGRPMITVIIWYIEPSMDQRRRIAVVGKRGNIG